WEPYGFACLRLMSLGSRMNIVFFRRIARLMQRQILREREQIAACESSLPARGAQRIWPELLLLTPGCPFFVFRFNRSSRDLTRFYRQPKFPAGFRSGH